MKQCNFQKNYGVIAQREVCSWAPIFNFFHRPPEFSLGANVYQKLPFFAILGDVNPHFQSYNDGADLGLLSPSHIL